MTLFTYQSQCLFYLFVGMGKSPQLIHLFMRDTVHAFRRKSKNLLKNFENKILGGRRRFLLIHSLNIVNLYMY